MTQRGPQERRGTPPAGSSLLLTDYCDMWIISHRSEDATRDQFGDGKNRIAQNSGLCGAVRRIEHNCRSYSYRCASFFVFLFVCLFWLS